MNRPIAVDLFCGAGGLSLGLKRAGFDVAVAVDSDKHVGATYVRNHKSTTFVLQDLLDAAAGDFMQPAGLCHRDVDLLAGCPPCKGFSSANHNRRNGDDPRNQLVDEFFRLVFDIKPKIFLFENVMGLTWYNGGYLGRSRHYARLANTGYEIRLLAVSAADYGVPQHRRRILIVGNRLGKSFRPPKATHGPNTRRSHVTVKEAIVGDLPPLGGRRGWDICDYARPPQTVYQSAIRGNAKKVHNHVTTVNSERVRERITHIPIGGNWSNVPSKFVGINIQYFSVYRRLDLSKPSVTLGHFRKNMLIHPLEDRLLSLREGARLQSFPDNYYFVGHIGHMQQQIADAAPPMLGYAIGRSLLRLLR